MKSLHAKAHTFASRTSPSTDQSLQKSVLFASPIRNSFFSSLPSVFYFFATHNRHQNIWIETAKFLTGQGLTMTEDRRPACNMGLASCGVKCLNSSAVFQFNFSAGLTVLCPEIPHERQAQNRYFHPSYQKIPGSPSEAF